MSPSTFPYLTVDTLEQIGGIALARGAAWFPEAAPILQALALLIPLVAHIPAVHEAATHLCERANHLTGAKSEI